MKKNRPADSIQDLQFFGEFGGVNLLLLILRLYLSKGMTMGEVFEG